jgi:hypothetical protein
MISDADVHRSDIRKLERRDPFRDAHHQLGHRLSLGMDTIFFPFSRTGCLTKYWQGAPIAGWILEAAGGAGAGLHAFRMVMWYAGSMSLASATLVLLVSWRVARESEAKVADR